MQSSEGWTSVPSLAHGPSVDSGSETDAFSLINANLEFSFSDTNFCDVEAISNMALPLGDDQISPENLPPITSAVVDWVQEQSQHDQPLNSATKLQRARVDGTPPRAGQAKQARTRTDDPASRQEGSRSRKKVYDIATLLRLKETQSAVPVMLRVKPEAIAGKCYGIGLSLKRADILLQRTSSSIWELQRHVDYPYALAAFPISPTSLLELQNLEDTPFTLQRDQITQVSRFVNHTLLQRVLSYNGTMALHGS